MTAAMLPGAGCSACGTTEIPHGGRGLCRRCYRRAWAEEATTRPWSKQFDACTKCGRSDSRHAADGICNRCWQRDWHATSIGVARSRRYQSTYHATERGQEVHQRYVALEETRRRRWLYNLRRRELREGVWLPLPDGYVEKTLDLFVHRCANCGAVGDLELDHHRPLEGGHALLGNSVPLCRSCNARKHTRPPERFYDRWTLITITMRLWELREWLADLTPMVTAC